MVGGGGGAVVGVVVTGLVGGGLVGAGPFGADVGRVVVDEDGLGACGDVVGTGDMGLALAERSRVPLACTVNHSPMKPCPLACDFEWSPALK